MVAQMFKTEKSMRIRKRERAKQILRRRKIKRKKQILLKRKMAKRLLAEKQRAAKNKEKSKKEINQMKLNMSSAQAKMEGQFIRQTAAKNAELIRLKESESTKQKQINANTLLKREGQKNQLNARLQIKKAEKNEKEREKRQIEKDKEREERKIEKEKEREERAELENRREKREEREDARRRYELNLKYGKKINNNQNGPKNNQLHSLINSLFKK